MAPKAAAPLPKALAGGSLLTEVVVNRYQYHLPFYRQSKILASYDAVIPDNTLGHWVQESGQGLLPVYQALWESMLQARYLQVDETPVKILKPEKQGYLWTYLAPVLGKGLVFFELSLTRSGSVAEKRLASFTGLLQTDGYNGYQKLRQRAGIVPFGCLSHARRKFHEVLKVTGDLEGIAAQVLERLKPVYALEETMRTLAFSAHSRKRLRQKKAWPILRALYIWLKQQAPRIPPKSKLATALHYLFKQWPYLIGYLKHGSVEIDTNWVENQIRPIALGKKNWLFISHEESGLVHALWYSLICSAVINGLNPRVYVHYLLMQIHKIRKGTLDPTTVLPHTIDHQQLRQFADQQIALARQVLNTS
jgi:hypothetical protein